MPKKSIEEKEKEVMTPRQCIKAFCLRHCPERERKNSKREVAECIKRNCPLHPYRTGQLRFRKASVSEYEKNRRFVRIRNARKNVEVQKQKLEKLSDKAADEKKKLNDIEWNKMEQEIEYKKAVSYLEALEKELDDELEQGIWK